MSAAFAWVNQLLLGIWGWFPPLAQYLLVTLGKIGLLTLAVIPAVYLIWKLRECEKA